MRPRFESLPGYTRWLDTHRVCDDYLEQRTYVTSLIARLQWSISWTD